jgi:CubicO group peptidase (beta-lactamase class C family)
MQEYGRLSSPKSETMPMFSSLKVITPLRSKWLYSDWGYAVATLMIEKVTGQSWGEFLEARIFGPLGLQRRQQGTPT